MQIDFVQSRKAYFVRCCLKYNIKYKEFAMNFKEKLMDILTAVLVYGIFFGVPLAVLLWFIISVIRFVRCDKNNAEIKKRRKAEMTISGIIFAMLFIAIAVFLFMLNQSLKHM